MFGNAEHQRLISGSSRDTYVAPPTVHGASVDPSEQATAPPHMASSSQEETYRWDHIVNLDQFFSRVYEYHQGGGFLCISFRKMLNLVQFIFIVFFSTFFIECIDYDVMFANKNTSTTGQPISGKKHFSDVVIPNCSSHLHPLIVVCILFATIFWMSRVVKTAYYLLQLHEIQLFYNSALGIKDAELANLTWISIVNKICEVQPSLHLTINTDQLTPFDIHNRVLRFKNYLVAMINQGILPPLLDIPFLGQVAYLPNGLKYNMKRCLFYGSTSPWDGPVLKEEYKSEDNIEYLSRQMEKHVAWYGLMNLVLMPFTFIYQILYSFFLISELIKKNPDTLGMRRYSNYGRYRVRHFNELNHDLDARLNRSHIDANAYMNQFFSPLMKVVASNIRFMVGAVGLTLTGLTMWDEDVIQIEHLLTVIAGCGGVFVLCNSLIPEENMVWHPEELLTQVTSELQCVPTEWKGKAHTVEVRREFEELFQLKWMFLLHELASPLITPFILLFWMRPRSRELVRFFHENTQTLPGLGDVCSFALLDVARHGDPRWNGGGLGGLPAAGQAAPVDNVARALHGKTEMSVLNFASSHPDWRAPPASEQFIKRFRARLEQDVSALGGVGSMGVSSSMAIPGPSSSSAVDRSRNNGARNLLLESVHSLMPAIRANGGRNRIGNNLKRAGDTLVSHDLMASIQGHNKNNADSLTQSLRQSGLDVDSDGADMRVQTLFLRGMHDEFRQSMAPSVYGTNQSMAAYNTQGLFDVPQFEDFEADESVMEASNGRSRMVVRAPQGETHYERDEDEHDELLHQESQHLQVGEDDDDDDDDARPPLEFGGV